MFDPLKGFNSIRQAIANAITPTPALPIEVQPALGFDTFKATSVEAHQGTLILPSQLRVLTQGQTVHFQRKALEYFKKLVARGEIDPKTVTPTEFVGKAVVLAILDVASEGWAAVARSMLAMHLANETLTQGRRERDEREEAMYELQQLQVLALAQQDARTTQEKRDYVTLTRKARENQA